MVCVPFSQFNFTELLCISFNFKISQIMEISHDTKIHTACWSSGQPAPYIHLARTFDLVEAERGKIKAMSMLCNMFRRYMVIHSLSFSLPLQLAFKL